MAGRQRMVEVPSIYRREWQRPIHRGYRLGCCDCGLVHRVDFRIVDGGVEFRLARDPVMTRRVRQQQGGTMAKKQAKEPKKRNPQDLTLRNNNARRKEVVSLMASIAFITGALQSIMERVKALEDANEDAKIEGR